MTFPRSLAADARALPPLSHATLDVIALLHHEDSTTEQLERILERDPAIAGNLLRIANSAQFGFARQIRSLSHAITLVGLSRMGQLAVTMSLQRILPQALPGYEISRSGFLVHSVAVAVLAQHLGTRLAPGESRPFYVAGLLHDIGKLLLARRLDERHDELTSELSHRLSLVAIERELLGTDHAEVAGLLGEIWQLPEDITAAASGHHSPGQFAEGRQEKLVDVIHVADLTAHALGYGYDIGGLARAPNPDAFHRLSVRPNLIEQVVSECLDSLVQTCNALGNEELLP